MLIDIEKIISPDDLKNSFEGLCEKLDEIEEAFIFQQNKPTHVIMTIAYYQQLTRNVSNVLNDDLDGRTGEESLETLLNKIGKKIFIDFYEVFKEDNRPEEQLPENFSLNSKRSRSSSARKIFRQGMQLAALNNIIQSVRMDEETLSKARSLLSTETDDKIQITDTDSEIDSEIKIGKSVRMFITKVAQKGIFSLEEIESLTRTDYTKNNFNLNFPVLKKYNPSIPTDEQKKDKNGYNRFYDVTINIGENEYFLCSQWVENLHRVAFEKWVRNKLMTELKKMVEQIIDNNEFTVKGLLNEYWTGISYASRKQLGKDFYNLVINGLVKNVSPLGKENGIQLYKKG